MSFYITLPSNVRDSGAVGTNSNASYVTQLPRPLALRSSEWEVGLVDIHYTNSWMNVQSESITISDTIRKTSKTLQLRPGRYISIPELVNELHRLLTNDGTQKSVAFHYDNVRHKVFLLVSKVGLNVTLSRGISTQLGFGTDKSPMGYGATESKNHPDIDSGMTSLFVYSSVVAPRMVGDNLVPLLRVVPLREERKKKFNDTYQEFRKVHYTPVCNVNTDLIEVDIRRDDGESVSFTSGKTILTLHFRPRRD